MLQVGSSAPGFSLSDQNRKNHSLKDQYGSWVLLYFYPKDDTSGCTAEACGFRDLMDTFRAKGCKVFGVSADPVEKHAKFAGKFALSFPILSDPDKKTIMAYDAWGEKTFLGKTYDGILRISYLIDPKGKIAKVYEKVKPEDHPEEVLADICVMMK